MTVEPKRLCGYRKVGGRYLVSASGASVVGVSVVCDLLPYALNDCPTCGGGIHQARGYTLIDISKLFTEVHKCAKLNHVTDTCQNGGICPFRVKGKHGLMWCGSKFYTPQEFLQEAKTLGISKRVSAVPREFELGVTYIFVGHPKALKKKVKNEETGVEEEVDGSGVITVFKPDRIELLITQTQSQDAAFMADLTKRKITAVIVPDDDPDHKGTVYDGKKRTYITDKQKAALKDLTDRLIAGGVKFTDVREIVDGTKKVSFRRANDLIVRALDKCKRKNIETPPEQTLIEVTASTAAPAADAPED